MKNPSIPSIAAALLSVLAASAQPVPVPALAPQGPVEVNGIAAKVNGRVITKNQVSFMMAPIYAQLATQYPRRGPHFETELKKAKKNILQELIDRQIILDEFKQIGASIKPHVIDDEVKRQVQELYNGDEAKFRAELQRSRLTMPGYREMTREKMVVQAMRSQQFADAPPPLPNEIQKEYQEIKKTLRDTSQDVISFRKIFLPATDPSNPASTPETQLELAEDLHRQIVKGADFAELAKTYSRDAFAEQGGLQERVARPDLAPEFSALLFEASAGSTLEPMLDPRGFTIVQIIHIDFGPSPPLSKPEVRQLVEERVRKKKTSAQYDRWIENRRKRAIIDIRI